MRRARVGRIIKWAARINGSKAAGPVARVMRDAMLPTILRLTADGKAHEQIYDHLTCRRPEVMLASRIMNADPATRRTTVAAGRGALATLEAEARRRSVPLTVVLAEAVEEKAARLRAARRPRVGLGRSSDGRTAAEVTADPVSHPPR